MKKRKKNHRKDSHRSRERSKRSSSSPPPPPLDARRRLSLKLSSVEIARGFDGPLRGRPEPVLVFAVFAVSDSGVTLLSRGLGRVDARKPYPSTAELPSKGESVLIDATIAEGYQRAVILGLAIERDSGEDVESIYAALADPESLSGWSIRDLLPEPISLSEAGRGALSTAPAATSVHLIRDGAPIQALCPSDEWVGSAVVVVDLETQQKTEWRYHFASEDGKNDWTALMRLWIS